MERKLFGSTQYVEIGKDVESGEEYLQLSVLNQWDWSNKAHHFHGENGITYFVNSYKRTNNHGSYSATMMNKEDFSPTELEAIEKYLNTSPP